jgi:hypothetical protein
MCEQGLSVPLRGKVAGNMHCYLFVVKKINIVLLEMASYFRLFEGLL